MLTRASLRGHPVHPMLVAFPLGLCTGGLAALFAFLATRDPFWVRVAYVAMLAGGVAGLAGMVFGAIDLLALPRDSRAKAIGFFHAGAGTLATILFLGSGASLRAAWDDPPGSALPVGLPLAFALGGMAALVGAGLLGWRLVRVHHVGVSPVPGRVRTALPGVLTHAPRDPARHPGLSA